MLFDIFVTTTSRMGDFFASEVWRVELRSYGPTTNKYQSWNLE